MALSPLVQSSGDILEMPERRYLRPSRPVRAAAVLDIGDIRVLVLIPLSGSSSGPLLLVRAVVLRGGTHRAGNPLVCVAEPIGSQATPAGVLHPGFELAVVRDVAETVVLAGCEV